MMIRLTVYFVTLCLCSLFIQPAQAQADYFVEAAVSHSSPYVGQQIEYSFRLYSRVSRTNRGAIVDPPFDGFWKQEFGGIRQYQASVEGQFYEVKERRFALFPTYAGTITIEPTAFVIEAEPDRPSEVLLTEPVSINVQPVPETETSTTFDGAVGTLEVEPTLDRLTTTTGEPVQLRLTVRGNGNIEQLPAPDIPASDNWRTYNNPGTYRAYETEDELVGEKTFEWLLTPLASGQQTLPTIAITYFDPATQVFQTLSTSSLVIDVQPAEVSSLATAVPAVAEALPLKTVSTNPTLQNALTGPLFWLFWLVPPILFIAVWYRQRQHRLALAQTGALRRSEALAHARKTLNAAQKASPDSARKLLRKAIIDYFADKTNRAPLNMEHDTILSILETQAIDPDLKSRVLECLHQADAGLYAPIQDENMKALANQTAAALTALDAQWR